MSSVEPSSTTMISIGQVSAAREVAKDALQAGLPADRGGCRSGSRSSRAALDPRPPGRAGRSCVDGLPRSGQVPRGLPPGDMLNGHEQDQEIEPERPALDVVEVVLDAFPQRGPPAPAVDLGPAGHPAGHGVPQVVFGHGMAELLDEDRALGPRADQAHLAPQDVEELGQLVDVGVPEPVADAGAAAVVVRGPDRAGLAFRVGAHAAELDDPEPPPPLPDPLLGVEDRPARGQKDGQGDDREQRGEDGESQTGDQEIGQPLRRAGAGNAAERPEPAPGASVPERVEAAARRARR